MISFGDIIGKPYALTGAGPTMFGCWGLAREIAARAGGRLPLLEVPLSRVDRNSLFDRMRNSGRFIKLDDAEPWSIAAFLIKGDDGKCKWHVGTVLPDTATFIHTTAKTGVCISRLDDPVWDLFCEGFFRYE